MNRVKFGFLSTLTVACIGALTFGQRNTSVLSVNAYTNHDAATYYNGISKDDTGDTLVTKLNALNNSKRQKLIGYLNMSSYFTQTDPGKRSGEVTAFYSGTSAKFSGNMNREHVWPFSRLDSPERGSIAIEKDMHMIRPAMADDNTGRGNAFFTLPAPEGLGWDPGCLGDETYRGDSARIIFYSAIADTTLTVVDQESDATSHHTMGKLSTLLEWNLKYPVSYREETRNEAVEYIQGHRNPFIDHPEYACRIWGDKTDGTRKACAPYGENGRIDIRRNGVAVEKSSLELEDEVTFTSYYEYANDATYNWEITNKYGIATTSSVISIESSNANSVVIKGLSEGTAFLKASVTSSLAGGGTETLWTVAKLTVYPASELTGITVVNYPKKITYKVGEPFNSFGIQVNASFSDGRTENVTNDVTFSNTDFSTAGKKYVLVSYTYKGMTCNAQLTIFVNESVTPKPKDGCGGNIATTSVLLSSLSLVSALLITISIRKKKRK